MAGKNSLITFDDASLIEITPIVKDDDGTIISHGQPTQVSLAELVTYLQTKEGWIEDSNA